MTDKDHPNLRILDFVKGKYLFGFNKFTPNIGEIIKVNDSNIATITLNGTIFVWSLY